MIIKEEIKHRYGLNDIESVSNYIDKRADAYSHLAIRRALYLAHELRSAIGVNESEVIRLADEVSRVLISAIRADGYRGSCMSDYLYDDIPTFEEFLNT